MFLKKCYLIKQGKFKHTWAILKLPVSVKASIGNIFHEKSTNKGDDNRTRINHSRWNQKNRICINGHVKKTNQNIYPVPSQKSFRLLLVVIRISNVNVRISNKFNILGLQQSIQKRNNKLINHQHNYKVHEAHHDKHFYTRFTAR